jgi:uncharacterized membrane protein
VANKKNQNTTKQVRLTQASFQGPLPPPTTLEKYNDIIPNGAERIMKMAEDQSKHRQDIEKKAISSDITNSRLGLIFGLTIGLGGILSGTYCIINGYPKSGTVLFGSTIGSLVGTFVYGSKSRKSERSQKQIRN